MTVIDSHLEHVVIGDGTTIRNAYIAGSPGKPTVIGKGCQIGMSPAFACQVEFANIGDGVRIKDSTQLKYVDLGDETTVARHVTAYGSDTRFVKTGKHVQICYGVYIDGACGVTIGDFVGLGVLDVIYSATGASSFSCEMESIYPYAPGPVVIGRHSWIPSRSTILPGVEMAEGCLITPHSVVHPGSYDPWTMYAGAPARRIKELKRP